MSQAAFSWIPAYTAIAQALYSWKDAESNLIDVFLRVYDEKTNGLKFSFKNGEPGKESGIDPFTFFGAFNRSLTEANRIKSIRLVMEQLDISASTPEDFEGVPTINNQASWFFAGNGDRGDSDIHNLWLLFKSAMEFASNSSQEHRAAFIEAFDVARTQKYVTWNISSGLFWIAPSTFISLDEDGRHYLTDKFGIKLKSKLPTGDEYLAIMEVVRAATDEPFYELSADTRRWKFALETSKSCDSNDIPSNVETKDDASPVQTSAKKPYADAQFLQDVFVSKSDLTAMKGLLERKKSLILQGAPGTGKTYAARRLAYAMMGEEDDSRIGFVQFHQSYTYEDFVIGYRPNGEGGFDIQPGIFADFCARAARDSGRSYFFIIDEINRANISKVFGELLMLIEADHRGDSIGLPLDRRRLTVPENLYIIGMMNTADRGLALIDYALRRRFAFFDMKPALDAPGFLAMLQDTGNEKLGALVDAVREINKEIEKDLALGQGFCIGHSYFCVQNGVTDEDVHGIARFEIEPLIAEYWFDDQQKVRKLTDKLESVFNA